MNFSDIEGHERPIGILKRALQHNTLAHAYLFSGQDGIGKKLTALALAAALSCSSRENEGGCGICPACRKVAAGSHPDVHHLSADGDEIKIDQVRQVQADFSLKSFEGSTKILIVDGAENMNPSAANAFLKTLEEPSGDALIILITPMPHSLLPTIRSRCQEIRFIPLPRQILSRVLRTKRGLSEDDAWFLAALCQGSLGRGLAMDVEQEKSTRAAFLQLFPEISRMSAGELLGQAEDFGKDRERFEQLLDMSEEFLRDALVYGITGDKRLLVYPAGSEQCRQWGSTTPLPRTLANIELVCTSRTLLNRRTSAQLVAENLFLGIAGNENTHR